jgi:hypothetical protein
MKLGYALMSECITYVIPESCLSLVKELGIIMDTSSLICVHRKLWRSFFFVFDLGASKVYGTPEWIGKKLGLLLVDDFDTCLCLIAQDD